MVCEFWVKNVFIVFIKDTNFRVLFSVYWNMKNVFFALCMAESKSSYRVWNIEITWCLKNDEQSPFTLKVSIIDITHVLTIHELLKNLQGVD